MSQIIFSLMSCLQAPVQNAQVQRTQDIPTNTPRVFHVETLFQRGTHVLCF